MRTVEGATKEVLEDIGRHLKIHHLAADNYARKGTGWRTYRQKRAHRIKTTIMRLKPEIDTAVHSVSGDARKGRRPSLSMDQKIVILLVMQLMGDSSRGMAYMLAVFSAISGIYISYKMIERLYSDDRVYRALLKLRELLADGAAAAR